MDSYHVDLSIHRSCIEISPGIQPVVMSTSFKVQQKLGGEMKWLALVGCSSGHIPVITLYRYCMVLPGSFCLFLFGDDAKCGRLVSGHQ